MPVILARREKSAVAGPDHFDRSSATLREADTIGDIDGLTIRMRVPCRPRARSEVDAARVQSEGAGRSRDRVYVHDAREPFAGTCRSFGSASRDVHRFSCWSMSTLATCSFDVQLARRFSASCDGEFGSGVYAKMVCPGSPAGSPARWGVILARLDVKNPRISLPGFTASRRLASQFP